MFPNLLPDGTWESLPYPDVMLQLVRLQDVFNDHSEEIGQYCHSINLKALFVIVISMSHDTRPLMDLPAEFVSMAARMRAGISFDIYSGMEARVEEC